MRVSRLFKTVRSIDGSRKKCTNSRLAFRRERSSGAARLGYCGGGAWPGLPPAHQPPGGTTPESSKGWPKVHFPPRQPCLEGDMTFGKPQISEVLKGFTPSNALAWYHPSRASFGVQGLCPQPCTRNTKHYSRTPKPLTPFHKS